MRISFHSLHKQRGFGLFETLLTLTLVLLLGGVSYATFAPASTSTQLEREASRLDNLRRSIAAAYVSAHSFADLTPQRAIDQGWLGAGSGDGRSTMWGALTISPANIGGMPADGWQLTLSGLPGGACEQLLASQRNRWSQITIDGKPADDPTLIGCGSDSTAHTLVMEEYGGARPGFALQPLCFDHSREWVAAHGAPAPSCPSDPSKYGVAKS